MQRTRKDLTQTKSLHYGTGRVHEIFLVYRDLELH